MADPILHIKDSYYFEVPKIIAPANYKHLQDLPEVWVKLDPTYQQWEFEQLYHELTNLGAMLPSADLCEHDWQHWVHADHANFAKPFDQFLQEMYDARQAEFRVWKANRIAQAEVGKNESEIKIAKQTPIDDYIRWVRTEDPYLRFIIHRSAPGFDVTWNAVRQKTGNYAAIRDYQAKHNTAPEWNTSDPKVQAKFDAYNDHLSGKILIPQPFGELRNLYERESGLGISKFLLIEIFVGLVLVFIFHQLAKRVVDGRPPRGVLWNLLELFLVFIRDQIARPVFGAHEVSHGDEHGHAASHDHSEHGHAQAAKGNAHHPDPAQQFLPLLWTIFFFVLGCNLMGMVPWAGTPTAALGVTFALACITFGTVVVFGMRQFGVAGFFLNQIPGMALPWYMAIIIKPMLLVIELVGLCIKHGVLAVRLLANMLAGHLVLLGIMGFAFGAEAALQFTAPDAASWQWGVLAAIAVSASAAFSCLELFVAFLQAYVFTFLSALFIGAAIHKH